MDLSDFFTTKSQANDFLDRLSVITGMIYTTHFDIAHALSQQFGVEKKDIFLKLFKQNNVTQTKDLEGFFKKVQDIVHAMPIVSLIVAFNPTDQTMKKLSEWFAFTLKKQVLFDIQIDTSLIAGGIIGFNGKSKDYSMRQLFDGIITKEAAYQDKKRTPLPALHQSTESMNIGR